MSKRYCVTTADDWQALYVDGKKVAEGHRIGLHEFEQHIEGFHVQDMPPKVDEAMAYAGECFPDEQKDLAAWANELVEGIVES